MTSPDPIALLERLVATRSLSGDETAAADLLTDYLRSHDLEVERWGDNVVCRVRGEQPGATFLLNSHLDTVPAKEGWETDPWTPQIIDGRLVGLGSGDAKGSVAAMACAAIKCARAGIARGELIFAATVLEETGGGGLEEIRPRLGAIDGALVGEPTSLEGAVAQSGMMIIEAMAHGRTAHAARSHLGVNALTIAARDLLAIDALTLDRVHQHLGKSSANVTVIRGGDRHNVIPDACAFTIDIRYTPSYSPAELFALLDEITASSLSIRSERFLPVETSTTSRVIQALQHVAPDITLFGSPTMSDWVHLKGTPTVKIGPGQSERSHTPNESVSIEEVRRAVDLYADTITHFFDDSRTQQP